MEKFNVSEFLSGDLGGKLNISIREIAREEIEKFLKENSTSIKETYKKNGTLEAARILMPLAEKLAETMEFVGNPDLKKVEAIIGRAKKLIAEAT